MPPYLDNPLHSPDENDKKEIRRMEKEKNKLIELLKNHPDQAMAYLRNAALQRSTAESKLVGKLSGLHLINMLEQCLLHYDNLPEDHRIELDTICARYFPWIDNFVFLPAAEKIKHLQEPRRVIEMTSLEDIEAIGKDPTLHIDDSVIHKVEQDKLIAGMKLWQEEALQYLLENPEDGFVQIHGSIQELRRKLEKVTPSSFEQWSYEYQIEVAQRVLQIFCDGLRDEDKK